MRSLAARGGRGADEWPQPVKLVLARPLRARWKWKVRLWTETRKHACPRGAPAGALTEHLALTENFSSLALSPDGKKIALVARGDVFAASAKDGGDALRLTQTPQSEGQIVWSPDSRSVVYVSDRDPTSHLYRYDFASATESRLTTGSIADHSPRFSPDGKLLTFVRGDRELRVLDLGSKQDRVLATGAFDRPPFAVTPASVWSPDNRWVAYLTAGAKGFTNVHIAAIDGSATIACAAV